MFIISKESFNKDRFFFLKLNAVYFHLIFKNRETINIQHKIYFSKLVDCVVINIVKQLLRRNAVTDN